MRIGIRTARAKVNRLRFDCQSDAGDKRRRGSNDPNLGEISSSSRNTGRYPTFILTPAGILDLPPAAIRAFADDLGAGARRQPAADRRIYCSRCKTAVYGIL